MEVTRDGGNGGPCQGRSSSVSNIGLGRYGQCYETGTGRLGVETFLLGERVGVTWSSRNFVSVTGVVVTRSWFVLRTTYVS